MDIQERDKKFLSALKRVYKAVSTAPASLPPLEVRRICTARIREAFSIADFQIKGSEYLPYQKNVIFIYNHLNNHDYYTEDEGFQITLDSHFISSMILDKYYKDSGTRVVRHSLPEEDNHRTYYKRLNYIRVYTKNFLPKGLDPNVVKSFNKDFYIKAIKHLSKGSGLVFSPEGNSYKTEDSPGAFRYGIFKLAACMSPQPLIVPLVMANFDKLASQDSYKCEIKSPFKICDWGITDKNDPALTGLVSKLNQQYKGWVTDLLNNEMGFESEITALEKRVKNKKIFNDLVVFYGSSTIRLWNSLEDDFPHTNTLNLGFGGAFISSLYQNFERLFTFEAPKAIVLYLGGNDLSLGWTAEKIIEKIKTLIVIIHSKFPSTSIINLSIKPSIERSDQIEKIIQINKAITLYAEKTDFLIQVNLFDDLLKDGKANPNYFLRDGLHLNGDGYKILKKQIKNYL
jgi:lysophospholipase L1-like esterase